MATSVIVFFAIAISLTIIEAVIIVVLLRRYKLEQPNTDGTGDVGEKFFYDGKWYQIKPERAEYCCDGCAFYGTNACDKFDCLKKNVIYKEVKK